MTTKRTIARVGCIAVLVLAMNASADIGPSFRLETCAWQATDIVVATQADGADGNLTVLETWTGKLAKGETIHVIDLPIAPIPVSTLFGEKPSPERSVTGKKIVLFLQPATIKEADAPTTRPAGKVFEGTDRHNGAMVSAVWIEENQAYAYQQLINPGPTTLQPLGGELDLVKETFAILATKDELRRIETIELPLDRVRLLAPITSGPYWRAREEAFAALGRCGPAALPLLRVILRDERLNQSDVIRALAAAAGPDAAKEFTGMLQDELAYWKSVGPSLKSGWWNADPAYKRSALQTHSNRLQASLCVLATIPDHPARDVVIQVRELWSSLPQLNDKSSVNQVIKACDEALKTAK